MSARRKKSVSFSTDVSPDAKTTKVASFHIPASDEKPTQANDAHAQDAKPDVGTVQAVVAFGLVKVGFRYEAELPAPTFAGWRVKGVKLLESGVGDVSVETDTASAKCSVVLDASVDGKVDVDIPVQLGLEHVSTDSQTEHTEPNRSSRHRHSPPSWKLPSTALPAGNDNGQIGAVIHVTATVMGKHKGTPQLHGWVRCRGKLVCCDSEEETEWAGF